MLNDMIHCVVKQKQFTFVSFFNHKNQHKVEFE